MAISFLRRRQLNPTLNDMVEPTVFGQVQRPGFASARKPLFGDGYLAGSFPGGITTVDGVPVSATVRVLCRPTGYSRGDGVVVAEVQSAPDGTWLVDGLDPSLRYDVVGRLLGKQDVIVSDVSPKTSAGAVDPYWSQVVMYLPLTEDFQDVSNNSVVVVNHGCMIASSGGAIEPPHLLAGPQAYLEADLDAAFGAKDFTVEFFVKAQAAQFDGYASFEGVIGQDFELLTITAGAGPAALGWVSATGSSWYPGALLPFGNSNDGNWHHLAFTRQGTAGRLFCDGALVYTLTLPSGALPQKGPKAVLGKKGSIPAQGHTVRLQHIRVTKGVARYTAAFVPPTKAFPVQ